MAYLPLPQLPTRRFGLINCAVALFLAGSSMTAKVAKADILMPGHKPVSHVLVFQESELFHQHRLVAAPIKGLGGWTEVQPGQPFEFSNKYGTRIFLIPKDVKIEKFDSVAFDQWPHVPPPVQEVASLPLSNPVSGIVTQLAFTGVFEGRPAVQIVSEQRLNAFGEPVTYIGTMLLMGGVFLVGMTVTWVAIRRIQRTPMPSGNSLDSQVSH